MLRLNMTLPAWLVAGITLLAGPAHAGPVTPAPAPTWAGSDNLSGPVQADSVFRVGDEVHFIIAQPATRVPPAAYSSQVQLSCSGHSASVAYAEGVRRSYPRSPDGRYRPWVDYPPAQLDALYRNPAIVAACHDTPAPRWQTVEQHGNGQWLLIDGNSVNTQGPVRRFWAAWDEPAETWSLPYEAPRAQTREHLEMNCERGTYQVLARAVLDRDNHVSDGLVRVPDAAAAVKNDGAYEPLYHLLCEQPQTLPTLPAFAPRQKQQARQPVPYVPQNVVAAFEAVQLPKAAQSIESLRMRTDMTIKGQHRAVLEAVDFWPFNHSALSVQQSDGGNYTFTSVTFHGLVNLATRMYRTGTTPWVMTMTTKDATFSGDWATMPQGSQLQYSSKVVLVVNSLPVIDNQTAAITCQVGEQVPAARIDSLLSGQAKKLSCVETVRDTTTTTNVYYLQDYGLFFTQDRKAPNLDAVMNLQAVTAHRQ